MKKIDFDILKEKDLDDLPQYIYLRDILGETEIDPILNKNMLSSPPVKKITDQQFDDGSWDRFHTLSADSKTDLTTENALRRLLILGLNSDDDPIKKAFTYMEKYLKREIDFRDRKERLSDWTEINDLFAAAWMVEIDHQRKLFQPDTIEIVDEIIRKWALLITRSFSGDTFNHSDYSDAFRDIFGVKPGKRAWDIECFHIAAVLKGGLDSDIEEKFIDYLLQNEKGIYYIARGPLSNLPSDFSSRETSRFLFAHTVLSRYSSYKRRSDFVVDWLIKNRNENGLWDLGPRGRDNVFFPLSESWRSKENREIDSTLFVLRYFSGIACS